MSLAVGVGAFFFGKNKGKNFAGSFKVPSLDDFGSTTMDRSRVGAYGGGSNVYSDEDVVNGGLDMRRLDIVKAEDIDRDEDTRL